MASGGSSVQPSGTSQPYGRGLAVVLLLIGAACRLLLAARTFLNPDEALHYFVAAQPTLSQTYTTSLTTAHPPLMFLLMHWWIRLGNSELFLRLFFVMAGLSFSWVMSLWIKRVAGQSAALYSLAICLLSPALITLSAEVRQYSLLLLFCAACLYGFERAVQRQSFSWMAFSAIELWLGLLTHYSALIFAAAAGVYGLLRLRRRDGINLGVTSIWVLGQFAALMLCALLFKTQISKLRANGVPSEIAATWLRGSIFHRGSDHLLGFAISKTIRLFRYFFSHGSIGVLMLLLFLLAIVAMFCSHLPRAAQVRRPRSLATLLALPFAIAFATAVIGVYPYGGTRHDVILVLFAIPGIAIGLDFVKVQAFGTGGKMLLLVLLLIVCNVFASPAPPFIRPRNQRKALMENALLFVDSNPRGSTILADYQGGLVLGYYLCGKQTQLPFGSTPKHLSWSECGGYKLLTSVGNQNNFELGELQRVLTEARSTIPSRDSSFLLFRTGWIDDEPAKWDAQLCELGCEVIHNYGPNVQVSRCERP